MLRIVSARAYLAYARVSRSRETVAPGFYGEAIETVSIDETKIQMNFILII